MDTSTAATPTSSGSDAASGRLPRRGAAAPGPEPGWLALRDCALGGGGCPRVSLALLHPGVGVALVESGSEGSDTAERLRRALDARRFPAIFGGYPPIVQLDLPADRPAELGRALAAAFEAQPPLALAGGDAWVGTARAALEAEQPVAAPERPRARRRRGFPWRRVAVALAAAGGASAAALTLVSAPPGHVPGSVARRPAAVAAPVGASGGAPDIPRGAAPAEDGLTALDVADALRAAETAAAGVQAAAGPAQPADAQTGVVAAAANPPEPASAAPDAVPVQQSSPDPAAAALAGPPGAAPDAGGLGAGAAVAASGPDEAGGAPEAAAAAAAGDERPEPAPLALAAAGAPVASTARSNPPAPRPAQPTAPTAPNGAAAVEARPSPKPAAPQGPAAAGNRRTALSAGAPPAAEAGIGGRCRDILVRATMGEAISEGDKQFLRRGCQPRG